MLRQEVFDELRYLDSLIQNASVEEDGEYFTYKDICAKWKGECFRNDILNFTGNFTMEEIYEKVSVFFHKVIQITNHPSVHRAQFELQSDPDLLGRSEPR